MARLVLAALAAIILGQSAPAAEPVKDTPNAAFMRRREFQESLASCQPRVEAWLTAWRQSKGGINEADLMKLLSAHLSRLQEKLQSVLQKAEGVEASVSMANVTRRVMVGLNEGNPLWNELIRNQNALNSITSQLPRVLYNNDCSMLAMFIFLKDHKAETLKRATGVVNEFAKNNDTADVKFMLGAGNAGFDAATNEVVAKSNREMLFLVYGAVALLCLLAFRSWRATICSLVPLMLTSILAEALMVGLNIGVKVATLPVIALGVGIGVDYALYIMSILLAELRRCRVESDEPRQVPE